MHKQRCQSIAIDDADCFGRQGSGVIAHAEMQCLARAHGLIVSAKRFFQRRVRVGAVVVVDVHEVKVEPLERFIKRCENMLA